MFDFQRKNGREELQTTGAAESNHGQPEETDPVRLEYDQRCIRELDDDGCDRG